LVSSDLFFSSSCITSKLGFLFFPLSAAETGFVELYEAEISLRCGYNLGSICSSYNKNRNI